MQETDASQNSTNPEINGARRSGSRWTRALRVGCLVVLVTLCALVAGLGTMVQSGMAGITMPGGTTLKLGSDDFVLSNYSFQNGTTYFFDVNGNGVRNIVQLHYLTDSRTFELVLHYSNSEAQGDNHILAIPAP